MKSTYKIESTINFKLLKNKQKKVKKSFRIIYLNTWEQVYEKYFNISITILNIFIFYFLQTRRKIPVKPHVFPARHSKSLFHAE